MRLRVLLTSAIVSLLLSNGMAESKVTHPRRQLHHLLTFNVLDQADHFSAKLPNGLRVLVSKDFEFVWEVEVFRGKGEDNLLYPERNWHGAFPCQLSAWSHHTKHFPDLRIIPVRGYRICVVVDLRNVASTDESTTHYTGGTVRVSWQLCARRRSTRTEHAQKKRLQSRR